MIMMNMLEEDMDNKIEDALDYLQNDTKKSLEIFNEILEIDSKNIDAINGKGSALMKLNRFEEAEECFDYSLSINENFSALINKGLIFKNRREYEMALAYYNKAIECRPEFNQIVNKLKSELIEFLDICSEIDLSNCSKEAKKLIKDAINYEKIGKLWDSLELYEKAVVVDPKSKIFINHEIKEIQLILQKELLFKKPVFKNTKKDNLKNYAFKVFSEDEDDLKTLTLFNEVLKIDSNDLDVLNHKGILLVKLNKFETSIECFDKCLEINKNYYYARFNKGLVLRRMKRLDESLDCFSKLLENEELYDKVKPYHEEILEKLDSD